MTLKEKKIQDYIDTLPKLVSAETINAVKQIGDLMWRDALDWAAENAQAYTSMNDEPVVAKGSILAGKTVEANTPAPTDADAG